MTVTQLQAHFNDLYNRYWELQDDIEATEKVIDLLEAAPKYAGPVEALRKHLKLTKWHAEIIKGEMDATDQAIDFHKAMK